MKTAWRSRSTQTDRSEPEQLIGDVDPAFLKSLVLLTQGQVIQESAPILDAEHAGPCVLADASTPGTDQCRADHNPIQPPRRVCTECALRPHGRSGPPGIGYRLPTWPALRASPRRCRFWPCAVRSQRLHIAAERADVPGGLAHFRLDKQTKTSRAAVRDRRSKLSKKRSQPVGYRSINPDATTYAP